MFNAIRRFAFKTLSFFMVFTFLTCNIAFSSETLTKDTLSTYSVAKLISDHENDLAGISESSAGDFAGKWASRYAMELAAKMARVLDSAMSSGSLSVSKQEAENEFARQIELFAQSKSMAKDGIELFISAFRVAFKDKGEPGSKDITHKPASVAQKAKQTTVSLGAAVRWLTVEEATKRLNLLKIGKIGGLEHLYAELEKKGVSRDEFLNNFRTELTQMADILRRVAPQDELTALAKDNNLLMSGEKADDKGVYDKQVRRLDILRGVSELILQLTHEKSDVDNIARLKGIKSVFAKYPEMSNLLVKYFEARFDPSTESDSARGESAGRIRVEIQKKLRDMCVNFERFHNIAVALVSLSHIVIDESVEPYYKARKIEDVVGDMRKTFEGMGIDSSALISDFQSELSSADDEATRRLAFKNVRGKVYELFKTSILKFEDYHVLNTALGIMISTVKTDYFFPDRTALIFRMNARTLVSYDENGALIRVPPYALIWVHVPYGAYGAHSRYGDVARGGLRSIRPERTNLMNKVLSECVALSLTQRNKHMDIPESGSKGTYAYNEGLNAVAAAIGYADGLVSCMMDNELIKPSPDIASNPIDPLELGPDEGTAPLSTLITVRAWMKGLESWRVLITGKSDTLGGTSHMENNRLNPPEKGNRVTSQGVMQHAFAMVQYLRDKGRIRSKAGEPVVFNVTGGLEGDVASGIVERAIDHYGENVKIPGMVDITGVVFDPDGLDHATLLDRYSRKVPIFTKEGSFPADKLHAGGFIVANVYFVEGKDGKPEMKFKTGPDESNYVTLGPDTLRHLNTRALDPNELKRLGVEAYYKEQARLKENNDLVRVLERDENNRPRKIRVHCMYLNAAFFFLTRGDMLITGGGVKDSISKDNWPLFFDWEGIPVSPSITHGANVFIHPQASVELEKKGIVIEPDEKANSVGVEISSKMEVDGNLIFQPEEATPEIMNTYFEQVLAKCLESARAKFWTLRIEAENRPDESVVVSVSPAVSSEVARLAELVLNSNIIGDRESDYSEAALKVLENYFPDVSALDKAYPSTLERVFARMPVSRIRAIAAKAIAREVVLNLGVNAVAALSKKMNVKEIEIVRKYLQVANKMQVNEMVKSVIDNKEGLTPTQRIAKLRGIRKDLNHDIVAEFAVMESVIKDVKGLTKQVSNHLALRMEGTISMPSMAIIVKKNLEEDLTGYAGMNETAALKVFKDQYRLMKQGLRKTFGREGLTEVSTSDELIIKANELIAKGLKVIILDDGALTADLDTSKVVGNPGEEYCVVSAAGKAIDEDFLPFVNLNAMAMMGVGMLYNDLVLFEKSYKAFTGRDMPESMMADIANKILWLVKVLPRVTKVTGNEQGISEIRKLFEAAA